MESSTRCLLRIKALEYKALWAIKLLNLDIDTAKAKRTLDLHELEEIRLDAYESSKIYKERTKNFHDKKIVVKELKAGDQEVLSFGAITLLNKDSSEFNINGQRVKKYLADQVRPEGSSVLFYEPRKA
ncbi:PREDICTED: uncharacterized protein LOC104728046 [Camelina sativa]|uniref:Uncharacterized protein LOC104728046 n=1 Tax=Camelina sativa TaxID=90675 RepID=A0ABM0US83_CAMSA|nr:PREDICTED: uncharacterized protein LOC104728046 [Camelina sativa]